MSNKPALSTVYHLWVDYESRAVSDASQITESRRAFYAGARAMLTEYLLTISDEPPEIGLRHTQQLIAELNAFAREVIDGRA